MLRSQNGHKILSSCGLPTFARIRLSDFHYLHMTDVFFTGIPINCCWSVQSFWRWNDIVSRCRRTSGHLLVYQVVSKHRLFCYSSTHTGVRAGENQLGFSTYRLPWLSWAPMRPSNSLHLLVLGTIEPAPTVYVEVLLNQSQSLQKQCQVASFLAIP